MSGIAELKAEVVRCAKALAAANQAVHDFHVAKFDIKPGDVIKYTGTAKKIGTLCRVETIEVMYGSVILHVNPRIMNGDWSRQKRALVEGEWEKVK